MNVISSFFLTERNKGLYKRNTGKNDRDIIESGL